MSLCKAENLMTPKLQGYELPSLNLLKALSAAKAEISAKLNERCRLMAR